MSEYFGSLVLQVAPSGVDVCRDLAQGVAAHHPER